MNCVAQQCMVEKHHPEWSNVSVHIYLYIGYTALLEMVLTGSRSTIL